MPGENSAELGLIGSAAELALAAVVVEIASEQALLKANSTFYSAGEVLGAFRELLRKSVELPDCLGKSDGERKETAAKLLEASNRFGALFTARAGALHTGQGASRDVCYLLLSDTLAFLEALSDLRDWKSSLRDAPECPTLPKERTVLVSELLKTLRSNRSAPASTKALASLFLVAPEIPDDEPEWLQSLSRVIARPRKGDVAILLKVLERARVGELYRVGSDAEAMAVRITNDEGAPEISMQNAKTTLTRPESIFRAQVGTANGNLEKGILDLPNIRSIYDLFYVLVRNPELLKKGIATTKLSAHEVWPVIATSLRYSGTPGPVFFIARQLNPREVGQLSSLMQRASELDSKLLKPWALFRKGVEVVGGGVSLLGSELPALEQSLLSRQSNRISVMESAMDKVPRHLLIQDIYSAIASSVAKRDIGNILSVLCNDLDGRLPNRAPLLRMLLDVSTEVCCVEPIVRCLNDGSLKGVHTSARRALQLIDYAKYGKS